MPVTMMGSGGKIYKWNFGDGDSLNTADALITHAFSSAGTFMVSCEIINGCGNSAIYSQSVQVTSMYITGNVQNPLCNGQASGSVFISATGGTAPFTFRWNNNDTSVKTSNLTAGNYTVTVTDNYGCMVSQSFILTNPSMISIATVITKAGCGLSNGGAKVIPSGGDSLGYTFLWSTGEIIDSIKNKTAGVYSVTVKDSNHCSAVLSIDINNLNAPAVTLAALSSVCADAATITLSGGTPAGGIYAVNGTTATVFDPQSYGSGTYDITYTYTNAGNCTGSAIQTITVNLVPEVSLGAYAPDLQGN